MNSLISEARKKYHRALISEEILTIDSSGIVSNADRASALSKAIAENIYDQLMAEKHVKAVEHSSGADFQSVNMQLLQDVFPKMQSLRPGSWHIVKLGNENADKMSTFFQYEHLEHLSLLVSKNAELSDGIRKLLIPDTVIYRKLPADYNSEYLFIPYACTVSAWTIDVNASSEVHTEVLGMLRHKMGIKNIYAVTGEVLPFKIASAVLKTNDIDCCYHFALYELIKAVKKAGAEDSIEMLNILIKGKRLKDISDLPLDLCV